MTAPMDRYLAEARSLSVDFTLPTGVLHAVRDASWQVRRGETLAIVGESGSGKSVSVEALMGVLPTPPARVVAGQLLFDGQDLLKMSAEARRKMAGRDLAMIFQDTLGGLNPVYPVGWQIAEMCRIHGLDRRTAKTRAIELLEKVGIRDAARRAHEYPHQFSGGQRQRVMIAMAIAMRPALLIADEPTSALDVTVQSQILRLLKDIQQEAGMGMVLVTHDMGVVAEFADRTVVMKNGEVVESGTTAHVLNRPQHAYVRNLIDAVPGTNPPDRSFSPELGPQLLSIKNLSKHYKVKSGSRWRPGVKIVHAVDNVSFSLAQGETLGVVGESGSGKSTLVRMLLALEKPSAGSVDYCGRDIFQMDDQELRRMRRRVQVVFQDPAASLNPLMSVEAIISEAFEIHPELVPKKQRADRVAYLLEEVGLKPEHAKRHPHQFSGGQKQRIAIARAIAMQPQVIVCDEAVSALDVTIQAQIMGLLKKLRSELGISYIFIAHNLALVRDFASRVLVMYQGKIVEQGPIDSVFDSPQDPYTKRLLSSSFLPTRSAEARVKEAVSG
jgi:peptide/nickel transport system ATP-binding protein